MHGSIAYLADSLHYKYLNYLQQMKQCIYNVDLQHDQQCSTSIKQHMPNLKSQIRP